MGKRKYVGTAIFLGALAVSIGKIIRHIPWEELRWLRRAKYAVEIGQHASDVSHLVRGKSRHPTTYGNPFPDGFPDVHSRSDAPEDNFYRIDFADLLSPPEELQSMFLPKDSVLVNNLLLLTMVWAEPRLWASPELTTITLPIANPQTFSFTVDTAYVTYVYFGDTLTDDLVDLGKTLSVRVASIADGTIIGWINLPALLTPDELCEYVQEGEPAAIYHLLFTVHFDGQMVMVLCDLSVNYEFVYQCESGKANLSRESDENYDCMDLNRLLKVQIMIPAKAYRALLTDKKHRTLYEALISPHTRIYRFHIGCPPAAVIPSDYTDFILQPRWTLLALDSSRLAEAEYIYVPNAMSIDFAGLPLYDEQAIHLLQNYYPVDKWFTLSWTSIPYLLEEILCDRTPSADLLNKYDWLQEETILREMAYLSLQKSGLYAEERLRERMDMIGPRAALAFAVAFLFGDTDRLSVLQPYIDIGDFAFRYPTRMRYFREVYIPYDSATLTRTFYLVPDYLYAVALFSHFIPYLREAIYCYRETQREAQIWKSFQWMHAQGYHAYTLQTHPATNFFMATLAIAPLYEWEHLGGYLIRKGYAPSGILPLLLPMDMMRVLASEPPVGPNRVYQLMDSLYQAGHHWIAWTTLSKSKTSS